MRGRLVWKPETQGTVLCVAGDGTMSSDSDS